MTYAVKQDLIDRFGQTELAQLTDRTNGASIDDTVIGKALADADAKIDSYIAVVHQLPLVPVPATLVRIAGDIARYYLYDDRVTEQVKDRFEDAIRFLRDVAAGKASLGVDTGGTPPAVVDTVQFEGGQKVFEREDL